MDDLQKEGKCKMAFCRHVRANLGTQDYVNGFVDPPEENSVMNSLGAFL